MKTKIVFAFFLAVVSIAMRLFPHPANMAPIGALALFAGAYLPRRWGWALPLVAMAAGDAVIGFYDFRLMAVVYASFLIPFVLGGLMKRGKDASLLAGSSFASSVGFFAVTNFAVWAFSSWYPHTFAGLAACYIAALPFFRNTLLGDLMYGALFFGVYELFLIVSRRAGFFGAVRARLGFQVHP